MKQNYTERREGKTLPLHGDSMKKRHSRISALILGLVLLVLFVLPAAAESTSAAPQLPHAFIGMVEVEGLSAPDGLIVEAVGPGIRSDTQGNPVTTLTGGVYGRIGMAEQKLLVQGDIESGTPIEFYIGGIKAEVFPIATNGPWLEAYPYLPGEVTELNLRITSQPAAGQTREPTPVQTRIPSGQVPTVSGYPGLQLPQPEVIATYQPGEIPVTRTQAGEGTGPAGSTQPVTPEGESSGTSVEDSPEAYTPSPGVPAAGNSSSLFMGAAIVAFLVIIGAAAYSMSRKKPEDEEKE
jgi:hypothetical protein